MGIGSQNIGLVTTAITSAREIFGNNIRMLELGNQHIRRGITRKSERVTGKQYFTAMGIEHVSIDLCGLEGSLQYDLNIPIEPSKLNGLFHIVTDFGTTEHVTNQSSVFNNIHNLCIVNGFMVHDGTHEGYGLRHCIHHYTTDFFNRLALLNKYKILVNKVIPTNKNRNRNVLVLFQKTTDLPFIMAELYDGQNYTKNV